MPQPDDSAFRAVALIDRDGTLVEDGDYMSDPAQLVLLPGAAEAVRLLNSERVACVLTTNQSGIGRGYFDEAAYLATHARLVELLAAEGAWLDAAYFCPSAPEANDPRRKPSPGMYEDACRDLEIAGLPVYSIGDKKIDVELGRRAGGRGLLVKTGKGAWESGEVPAGTPMCETAMEAAETLLMLLLIDAKPADSALKLKLRPMHTLGREIALQRAAGKRVVLANGCFDLLHGGHVSYLEGARAQGDKLVLAVNSNRSIRALKGEGRPVLPEPDRLQMLAALECVDYLTLFYDATADRSLRVLKPDVHAKGTDYTSETVPERETARALGVETYIAGAAKENSSRDIITVIRERANAGLI